jgi:hypothetical protein
LIPSSTNCFALAILTAEVVESEEPILKLLRRSVRGLAVLRLMDRRGSVVNVRIIERWFEKRWRCFISLQLLGGGGARNIGRDQYGRIEPAISQQGDVI